MYLTEQELLVRQQEKLFGIQKIIKNSNIKLDDLTELIPGLVHLNKVHTLELVYIDKESRQIMEVSQKDLIQNGYHILMRHVKPESFQQAKRLFGKMTFEDPSHVVSHFQELKGFSCTNSSQYQWFFSVKKLFDDDLILTISNPICTLGTMQKQVEKILEENVFIRNNLPKINSLTCREKEIITLLVQGYNNPQISEQLYIARSTVETHRKNINKKLGFSSYFQLLHFAQAFDLV